MRLRGRTFPDWTKRLIADNASSKCRFHHMRSTRPRIPLRHYATASRFFLSRLACRWWPWTSRPIRHRRRIDKQGSPLGHSEIRQVAFAVARRTGDHALGLVVGVLFRRSRILVDDIIGRRIHAAFAVAGRAGGHLSTPYFRNCCRVRFRRILCI
jgi:hypothetical protein